MSKKLKKTMAAVLAGALVFSMLPAAGPKTARRTVILRLAETPQYFSLRIMTIIPMYLNSMRSCLGDW